MTPTELTSIISGVAWHFVNDLGLAVGMVLVVLLIVALVSRYAK